MSAAWKVPVTIATGIICFGTGLGLGALAMYTFDPNWAKARVGGTESGGAAQTNPPGPAGGMMGMGGGGMFGGRGGPPGGGFPGGGGPSSKAQLAILVGKLEQLTSKPLSINLTEEQQTKLREELKGLDEKEELSDDDAKKRLDAILEIVKDDKETLEAAGYRWPVRRPPDVSNPFKEEENAKHLKSLQEQLSKGKTD
jgi:hypothetical protein